jgi:hypothetical protein
MIESSKIEHQSHISFVAGEDNAAAASSKSILRRLRGPSAGPRSRRARGESHAPIRASRARRLSTSSSKAANMVAQAYGNSPEWPIVRFPYRSGRGALDPSTSSRVDGAPYCRIASVPLTARGTSTISRWFPVSAASPTRSRFAVPNTDTVGSGVMVLR